MRIIENNARSVDCVKTEIEESLGKHIYITEFNKQGKKIKEYNGEIVNTYNSLFLVRVLGKNYSINKSLSYVDLITNELEYEIQ